MRFPSTVPINLPRRLNSGFYFARSDPSTIAALKKVVKHASTSDLSEQPSFYDVLCGKGGANRVADDHCFEPSTKLTVIFLDRSSFPNGAYKGLWEKSDVRSACLKLGCVVLHNNWINGRKRKFERQVRSGLWDYDSSTRMCIQSWHRTSSLKWITSPQTTLHLFAYHQTIPIPELLSVNLYSWSSQLVCSQNFLCPLLRPSKRKKGTAAVSLYDSMVQGELTSILQLQNEDSVVRIVLANRMVEVYDRAISDSFFVAEAPWLVPSSSIGLQEAT